MIKNHIGVYMKKYLILTVTAGEGHNSIAKAIENELGKNPENIIEKVDIFKEFAKPSKVKFINDGYILACKHLPKLYNLFFRMYQKRNPNRRDTAPAQGTVKKETPKLLKLIEEKNPDVIICTHFYPATIITNLRKKYEIKAKVVSILFDYTVHPFFECANGVDFMFTPDSSFNDILIKKGYREEQLKDLGLPVKTEFSEFMDKNEAREKLGFQKDLPLVMIMLGGGGFGGADKMLKKLFKCKHKIQIAVVNGKDSESKEKIDKFLQKTKTEHIIKNYGFIDFVYTLMSASDILVGKSGGVSVNESMNKNLPLALSHNLVAQEYDNMVFLTTHNACINLTKKYTLTKAVDDLCENPNKLEQIKSNIQKIKKPNATRDIVKFCEAL